MKRYAALIVAGLLALLGVTMFASSAQAQQSLYPTPSLVLKLSTQKVVSGRSFVSVARASIKCDTISETWNGQSASASGSVVTHTFKSPIVTKTTVIPLTAVCKYTTVNGVVGNAVAPVTHYLRTSANVTVVPSSQASGPGIPNTGGPSLGWFIAGAAAVLFGLVAMVMGRRRNEAAN